MVPPPMGGGGGIKFAEETLHCRRVRGHPSRIFFELKRLSLAI